MVNNILTRFTVTGIQIGRIIIGRGDSILMKKFKNLVVVLSLVLVLNSILPQAAVFAQAANNSKNTHDQKRSWVFY